MADQPHSSSGETPENLDRRTFLARTAGWSKAAIAAALFGAAMAAPSTSEARVGVWVNSRGGRGGGGGWVNGRRGGGAWANRAGTWVNRAGGWVNGGGSRWVNGGAGGGGWVNRRGGGGRWANRY